MDKFNAADFLGTGNVHNYSYCAWYRHFDREKFDRMFDAAIDNGAPFAYLKEARVAGKRTPYVEFDKYNDDRNHADLRCKEERFAFMNFCEKRLNYLDAMKSWTGAAASTRNATARNARRQALLTRCFRFGNTSTFTSAISLRGNSSVTG